MLHSMLSMGVVRDLKLQPLVFDAMGLVMPRQQALELLMRLDAIHDTQRVLAGDEGDTTPTDLA